VLSVKYFDEFKAGDYGRWVARRAKQLSDAEAMRNFSKKRKERIKVIQKKPPVSSRG
jgi:hypothetical protein